MNSISLFTGTGFATLSDFLELTANEDKQFILEPELELEQLKSAACGMVNGAGGWIVVGAGWDNEEERLEVRGVANVNELCKRLTLIFSEQFSVPLPVSMYLLNDNKVILLHVWPVPWRSRPVCVDKDYSRSYRRIEGVNVLSGLHSRFRLGIDALERLRDDSPASGITIENLHTDSVEAFRDAIVQKKPEWSKLSLEGFLSRTLVLSEGKVTRAGYFFLGRQAVRVRAELHGTDEAFEVRNLWRAWSELLPRLTRSMSPTCAAAFRECFVNALIHAEHDAGKITLVVSHTQNGIYAHIENPGLARAWRSGESECRNFRLMKIFQLLGAAHGTGQGLATLRRYAPDFRLVQNSLELSTIAILRLEAKNSDVQEQEPELEQEPADSSPLLVASLETKKIPDNFNSSNLDQSKDSNQTESVTQEIKAQEAPAKTRISFGNAAEDLENFVAEIKAQQKNK